jgi:hypothetical protein
MYAPNQYRRSLVLTAREIARQIVDPANTQVGVAARRAKAGALLARYNL